MWPEFGGGQIMLIGRDKHVDHPMYTLVAKP